MKKKALITGINGQDGSFLSELLIADGYDVHGIVRSTSQFNRGRIEESRALAQKHGQVFDLHYGNLSDSSSLHRIINLVRPTEIFNLASHSHVGISFDEPEYVTDVDATGVLRLLEAIRSSKIECRFFQASTSELFGNAPQTPQNEETAFHPRSPYGVAKLYAYWIVRNYREIHGLHASNGIMFNHESERRGENFVTRKITYSLAHIKAGLQNVLTLGNLDSCRDWGYARDYAQAMRLIIAREKGDDYVLATGKTHTVRDFIDAAAEVAEIPLVWEGTGVDEKGRNKKTGKIVVEVSPKYFRPKEQAVLCGNPHKAQSLLDWKQSLSFRELVGLMMTSDLKKVGLI
jgi:GDPmannose 4,6-dehydratase